MYLKFNLWQQVVWVFLFVYYIFKEKIATAIDQIVVPHNNIYLKNKRIISTTLIILNRWKKYMERSVIRDVIMQYMVLKIEPSSKLSIKKLKLHAIYFKSTVPKIHI